MPPDALVLTALAGAVLLALAGLAVRDVRAAALGAALVVTAGVSVPAGAGLVGLSGPVLVQTARRRRAAMAVLLAGLPVAVALSAAVATVPDSLPAAGGDSLLGVGLRGLGMAGLAYGGVHALRVWRRSRRARDLAAAAGYPLVTAALGSGEAVAWQAPSGAWEPAAAAGGILLLLVAPLLDTWAVAAAGRRRDTGDDPYVAAVERRLGVQLRGMLAGAAQRDPHAGTHSRRVASLGVRVAERMGLSTRLQGQVAAAGLLHHLGAADAATADGLLAAVEAPLAPSVREAVRDRSTHLAALEERYQEWDVTVPIVTRILAVCDAFETSAEDGLPPGEILAAMRAGAGERFCPASLEALEAVLEGGLHTVDPGATPAERDRR
ncbi:MAG: hypothetical protein IT200_14030 [Thermoleophilia bacterium]|nr:hypothetical protein [Thermoleophilia bacterium]